MALRYPVYGEADLTVDSMDGPPEATLSRVVAALEASLGKSARETGDAQPRAALR